jgi:hypothetical protein
MHRGGKRSLERIERVSDAISHVRDRPARLTVVIEAERS